MSDTMLFGVLRMPPDLWRDDEIDKAQRHARYVEAADRITELEAENERFREWFVLNAGVLATHGIGGYTFADMQRMKDTSAIALREQADHE